MRKRRSREVASAFPTGFREGYCCDCYDKLVDDIKKKKALQAERQRTKDAKAKKKEDEKARKAAEKEAKKRAAEEEKQRKAAEKAAQK